MNRLKGTLYDGTGAPPVEADVRITGDRIAEVGRSLRADGAEVIDVRGHAVAPGFIDIHSHTDMVLFAHPNAESKVRQGVTTEVVGNCGASFGPMSADLAKLAAGVGEKGYLALYSLVALATIVWMVHAYYRAPYIGLWYVPVMRYAPLAVMPFALILIVCGVLGRNPTAVGQERLLQSAEPARGILRVTRHPVMWGIALWAASHAAARGDAAALVFFGTFLLLALSGTVLMDRKKAARMGDAWQRFANATSNLPFAAIASGRNAFRPAEIGWMKPLLGIVLYLVLLFLHSGLFGARPY